MSRMHFQAVHFLQFVKAILPIFFKSKIVLDVGAGDINGNNRNLFTDCEYNGNDVFEGKNITIVSRTSKLPFENETFDTIISSECFEHDPEYAASWLKIYDMLKPGGLFVFTCASTGRGEHGTRRTSPQDSYGTMASIEDMQDYYKNLTHKDLNSVLPLNDKFDIWDTYYNPVCKDLYFVGIKKGKSLAGYLPTYHFAIKTTSELFKDTTSLGYLYTKYGTDKGPSFHNYNRQYEELFANIRVTPIKILEIGVLRGASLRAYRDYFYNADCVVGIDIKPECKSYENVAKSIFVEIGDATNKEFITEITKKYGTFDLILDDGSHRNDDVINSFLILFPLLNNKGIYVVEDTITYKSPGYINPEYPNHLTFFSNFIPLLNQWRHDSTEGIKDNCVDPFKINKKTPDIFEQSIDKIEFGCSYIAVHKLIRTHWI